MKYIPKQNDKRRYYMWLHIKASPGITSTALFQLLQDEGADLWADMSRPSFDHLVTSLEQLGFARKIKMKGTTANRVVNWITTIKATDKDMPEPRDQCEDDDTPEDTPRPARIAPWPSGYAIGTVPTLAQMAQMIVNVNDTRTQP